MGGRVEKSRWPKPSNGGGVDLNYSTSRPLEPATPKGTAAEFQGMPLSHLSYNSFSFLQAIQVAWDGEYANCHKNESSKVVASLW